jgi:hypothetical protein
MIRFKTTESPFQIDGRRTVFRSRISERAFAFI